MNCMFLNLSLQNELIETFNSIVFHMKDKLTQKVIYIYISINQSTLIALGIN